MIPSNKSGDYLKIKAQNQCTLGKLSLVGVVLIFLYGCHANDGPPQPVDSNPEEYPAELVPDVRAFRRSVERIDRVVIRYAFWHTSSSVELTDAGALKEIRDLLKDRSITPAPMPAMLGDDPWLMVFSGKTPLFSLRWQSATKFQIVDADDKSIAGSYKVPVSWHEQYLKFCDSWRPREQNR